jgi:hypothetical protein
MGGGFQPGVGRTSDNSTLSDILIPRQVRRLQAIFVAESAAMR